LPSPPPDSAHQKPRRPDASQTSVDARKNSHAPPSGRVTDRMHSARARSSGGRSYHILLRNPPLQNHPRRRTRLLLPSLVPRRGPSPPFPANDAALSDEATEGSNGTFHLTATRLYLCRFRPSHHPIFLATHAPSIRRQHESRPLPRPSFPPSLGPRRVARPAWRRVAVGGDWPFRRAHLPPQADMTPPHAYRAVLLRRSSFAHE
jgi:hypothetical protein